MWISNDETVDEEQLMQKGYSIRKNTDRMESLFLSILLAKDLWIEMKFTSIRFAKLHYY